MHFTITGKSLLELRKKYGTGRCGFYNNGWWLGNEFAKEKPPKGEYDIILDEKTRGKLLREQEKMIPDGYSVAHSALVAEAVLSHYEETGERLLESWYVGTASVSSDGHRVGLGGFDERGLRVVRWWDVRPSGGLGLVSARKLSKKELKTAPPESLKIELIINGKKYKVTKV